LFQLEIYSDFEISSNLIFLQFLKSSSFKKHNKKGKETEKRGKNKKENKYWAGPAACLGVRQLVEADQVGVKNRATRSSLICPLGPTDPPRDPHSDDHDVEKQMWPNVPATVCRIDEPLAILYQAIAHVSRLS
jgi:hypothetical protein